jgi:rubrerythrin
VGSDADNLKDAMNGESYEVETMYREFAEKAAAAGDKAVAERFEEIRRDEMKHRDAFKAALARSGQTSGGIQ